MIGDSQEHNLTIVNGVPEMRMYGHQSSRHKRSLIARAATLLKDDPHVTGHYLSSYVENNNARGIAQRR